MLFSCCPGPTSTAPSYDISGVSADGDVKECLCDRQICWAPLAKDRVINVEESRTFATSENSPSLTSGFHEVQKADARSEVVVDSGGTKLSLESPKFAIESQGSMNSPDFGRYPSMLSCQSGPDIADEINAAVSEPQAVLKLMASETCFFGITEKNGHVVVEPEFQDKLLAVSGEAEAARLRESLVRSEVGFACKKARKPELPNQDNILFFRTSEFTLFAIADGHGNDGHWVSHWVVRFVLHLVLLDIAEYGLQCLRNADSMMRVFNLTHEALERRALEEAFDVQMSGTTLCLCAVAHKTLEVFISSVGDSGCVLSRASGEPPQLLTTSHKPDDLEERRRIVSKGGVVLDGRVWVSGEQTPGLAMSRSIGDLIGHSVGVIHQPAMTCFTLEAPQDKEKKHLFLCASDGIWDFIDSDYAVKIVRDLGPGRVNEAVNTLAEEARDRWLQDSGDELTDDISIIAVWV